jgi:hypothetical protein
MSVNAVKVCLGNIKNAQAAVRANACDIIPVLRSVSCLYLHRKHMENLKELDIWSTVFGVHHGATGPISSVGYGQSANEGMSGSKVSTHSPN